MSAAARDEMGQVQVDAANNFLIILHHI